MQDNPPSRLRKPTPRRSAERSAQRERTVARCSSPGSIVTTRKIALFVSGDETSCGRVKAAAACAVCESDAISVANLSGKKSPSRKLYPDRERSHEPSHVKLSFRLEHFLQNDCLVVLFIFRPIEQRDGRFDRLLLEIGEH